MLVLRVLIAVIIGGALTFAGWQIFVLDPIMFDKGSALRPVTEAQIELISLAGYAISGFLLMSLGVFIVLWAMFPFRTSFGMKLAGAASAAIGLMAIYYGYSTYLGEEILLEATHGRRQGLQQLVFSIAEGTREKLGATNAGILFMALGAVWTFLSVLLGFVIHDIDDEEEA